MVNLENNIAELRKRIRKAAENCARDAGSVELLAVSKTKPAELVRSAYNLGLRRFGENYLQEALDKQSRLKDLDIEWHFIGPVQSNKTRAIAEHFDWIQSLDRRKIAQRLSEQRPAGMRALNCCIQVNIDDEASKAGVPPAGVEALAEEIRQLPGLKLRGLMAIPRATEDPLEQRHSFARMRRLFEDLQARDPAVDTLSMGMSGDLEAAIAEGASLIRVGTALFGKR